MLNPRESYLLPDGATSHRITDILDRPAISVRTEDVVPQKENDAPVVKVEIEILEITILEEKEALHIFLSIRDHLRLRPKVDVGATSAIRIRHHAIARLMATGLPFSKISAQLSVSVQTLRSLERNPTFQALLLEYMNQMDGEAITFKEKLSIIGSLAMDTLTEKLVNEGSTFGAETLRKIIETTSDRTGYGVNQKVEHTHRLGLTPADIRSIKMEHNEHATPVYQAPTIEGSLSKTEAPADDHGAEEDRTNHQSFQEPIPTYEAPTDGDSI